MHRLISLPRSIPEAKVWTGFSRKCGHGSCVAVAEAFPIIGILNCMADLRKREQHDWIFFYYVCDDSEDTPVARGWSHFVWWAEGAPLAAKGTTSYRCEVSDLYTFNRYYSNWRFYNHLLANCISSVLLFLFQLVYYFVSWFRLLMLDKRS